MCASENISVRSWCCTGYIMGAWKEWIHCCLNLEFLKTHLKKKAFCSSCIPFRSIARHLIREENLKPLFLTLSFPTFSFLIVVALLFLQRKRPSSLWKSAGGGFLLKGSGIHCPFPLVLQQETSSHLGSKLSFSNVRWIISCSFVLSEDIGILWLWPICWVFMHFSCMRYSQSSSLAGLLQYNTDLESWLASPLPPPPPINLHLKPQLLDWVSSQHLKRCPLTLW